MDRRLVALAAVLLTYGIYAAPRGLHPRPLRPGDPAPAAGRALGGAQARRWMRVEVSAPDTLQTFLVRNRLASRTYVCRRECGGSTLPAAQCRSLTGALWVAAGDPEPVDPPVCEAGRE